MLKDLVLFFIYDIQPSREFPLKAKFFYDVKQSPAYELTYIYQVYTALLLGVMIVSAEFLLINSD